MKREVGLAIEAAAPGIASYSKQQSRLFIGPMHVSHLAHSRCTFWEEMIGRVVPELFRVWGLGLDSG